jgi:ABC-2 type transport system permease protein
MRIGAVARKELLHIIRDPRTLIAVVAMPILQLFLFSYALSFDVKNISTAVLDQDKSQQSREFVAAFEKSGYFTVTRRLSSLAEADDVFNRGLDRAVVMLGPGYGERIAAGEKAQVAVLLDGSEPNSAQLGQGYANGLVRTFGGKLTVSGVQMWGFDPRSATSIRPMVRVWYNPEAQSAIYLIPGLVVVLIMFVTIQQTANTLVREKDAGTFEQLLVAPLRRGELMVGKLAPYVVLAAIDVVSITAVGVWLFGVPFRGDVGLYALASLLFIAGCLGFGLIISARATTIESANILAVLLSILPGFMLSGFVFPIRNMPAALQYVTYLFPARYYMVVNRTVFLKGAGLVVLWPQFVGLTLYALATLTLASLMYQRRVE